ncbi:B12-binding domain-containing radical SAM protein [Nanoarchaeota archaeon]
MKKLNLSTKKDPKIALISLEKEVHNSPPTSLVYLATSLKERGGFQNIKIIDMHFDNVNEELGKFNPDIIGITSMTVDYQDVLVFAKNYKKKKNIPIIIGGVHISTLPSSFESCFDVGVIGEGEETLRELVELFIEKQKFETKDLRKIKGVIYLKNEKIKLTKLRSPIDIDTLPFPDYTFVRKEYFEKQHFAGMKSFLIPTFILTSRGCPYQCKFCSTTKFWGRVRLHSPKYIARLIKHSVENYNSNYILIMDDLFTMSSDWLKKIKEELEELNILEKIEGMDCAARSNLIDDEMCKVFKELKVKMVNFGFESGSERMLKWLKGGSVTVKDHKNAIRLCKKYKLMVFGSLIFGSPGEKIEDMRETLKFIDFAIQNKVDYLWSFIATPFPATVFWTIASQRGKVNTKKDWNLLAINMNDSNLNNPPLLDSDVDNNEFKKIICEAEKKLRKMRINQMLISIRSNPFEIFKVFFSNPKYYTIKFIQRFYK